MQNIVRQEVVSQRDFSRALERLYPGYREAFEPEQLTGTAAAWPLLLAKDVAGFMHEQRVALPVDGKAVARFIADLIPALEVLASYAPQPGTSPFSVWYPALIELKFFLAASAAFPGPAREYLQAPEFAVQRESLMHLVHTHLNPTEADANLRMRAIAPLLTSGQWHTLLGALTSSEKTFSDPCLFFEQCPEVRGEMTGTGMGSRSRVLVLGSGAFPASALGFASAGARVFMIDRDPAAIAEFWKLGELLPISIQSRIRTQCIDAAQFDLQSIEPTHVLLSGQLDKKRLVMQQLEDYAGSTGQSVFVITRSPQSPLLEMIYSDGRSAVAGKHRHLGEVDCGVLACTRSDLYQISGGT